MRFPGYFGRADEILRIEGTSSGFRTLPLTLNYPRFAIRTLSCSRIVCLLQHPASNKRLELPPRTAPPAAEGCASNKTLVPHPGRSRSASNKTLAPSKRELANLTICPENSGTTLAQHFVATSPATHAAHVSLGDMRTTCSRSFHEDVRRARKLWHHPSGAFTVYVVEKPWPEKP
jgi:hypothetical protein